MARAKDKPEAAKPSDKEALLSTARDRYKRGLEVEDQNRKNALEAIKFRNGEQWDPAIKKAREQDPEGARPCPVVDKTNQYLRQVVNDEKQNRPAIKIRPVDDKGDPEVAKILQGIIRNIEDQSGADLAYDTAYEQAADGGFGYFRVLAEYCDPMSFDQDIRIRRVRNRFQVVLDDARQLPDGSDSKWGFIAEKMPRDEFTATYPKANPCDFEDAADAFAGWIEEKTVTVAEYYRIEERDATICLYMDGSVYEEGKAPPGAMKVMKNGKPAERKTKLKQLKWAKITAKDVLEERDLPGSFIPIPEVVGEEIDIEGKSVKNGLLQRAMEPARIHNYASASFIENVALAPRAPWVAAEEQIAATANDWRTANRRNISVLTYKPLVMEGGVQVPAPQRSQPPGIPVGWQAVLQNSEHDISASMGMYAQTTLGMGDAQSGKQEALQQRRGDTATFHFMDNLARSVRYAGKIILEWIPTYYDTARIARIIGEDGTPEMVKLNPDQEQAVLETEGPNGKEKTYNLKVGKYDVSVQTGPGFMTKRQEAVEFMTQAIQAAKDPATAQVLTYLAVKNNDFAGGEEATKALKSLLPPPVAAALANESEEQMVQTPQGPVPASQAGQMMADMGQQLEQAGEALKAAGDIQAEAAALEKQKLELDARLEKIAAAERELALKEQLAESNLQRQLLEAKNELLTINDPEVIAQKAAGMAVDNVLNQPVQ